MGRKNASRTRRRNQRAKQRRHEREYGRLFNGNIYAQWEFIFIWALILLMIISLAAYIYIDSLPLEKCNIKERDQILESADIAYSDTGNKNLDITVNGKEYKAFGYCTDIDSFLAEVSVGDEITVRTVRKDIVGLAYNGKEYISPEKIDEQREAMSDLWKIPAVMAGVWGVYVAISWYVMYNAQKYPRLVRLFVKSEYIRKDR